MDAKPARGKPLMLNKAALPFLLVLAGGWSGVAFASSTSRPPVYWSVAPEDRQERDPALFRSVMLRAHNAARREAGQQPLRWNEGLAADALRYASELARTRRFQHSTEPRGAPPQGEPLWMGSTGYFSYAEMVRSWTDEKRYFRRDAYPNFSTTGRWRDVGHYTQRCDERGVGKGRVSPFSSSWTPLL